MKFILKRTINVPYEIHIKTNYNSYVFIVPERPAVGSNPGGGKITDLITCFPVVI